MALISGLLGLFMSRGVFRDLFTQSSHDKLAFWDILNEWRLDIILFILSFIKIYRSSLSPLRLLHLSRS
jgi:hypothetical protein